jgi:hypothetical protein
MAFSSGRGKETHGKGTKISIELMNERSKFPTAISFLDLSIHFRDNKLIEIAIHDEGYNR